MLIAIAVIAMVASAVGIQGYRAWQEQRFLASVDQVVDRIDVAQQLSLVHHMDASVGFDFEDGVWVTWLHSDSELPQALKIAYPPKIALPQVASIEVDPMPIGQDSQLSFIALEHQPPTAVITVTGVNGDIRYIFLKGSYAKTRARAIAPEFGVDELEEAQALLPREVYEG